MSFYPPCSQICSKLHDTWLEFFFFLLTPRTLSPKPDRYCVCALLTVRRIKPMVLSSAPKKKQCYILFYHHKVNNRGSLDCMCLTKAGSLLRQASVNSLKLLEKSPISVGGGDLGMRNSTRIGCMSEFGGSPLASSMAVMPRDQISAWRDDHSQNDTCYCRNLAIKLLHRKVSSLLTHFHRLVQCFVDYRFLDQGENVLYYFVSFPCRE